jgi:diguanylate cyclase (GGDEF)-like protein
MADSAASLQVQQLLELLAVVSALPNEDDAVHGAVERAAQALEAEVAAVVYDERVAACVGFPVGAVPTEDLLAVAHRQRDWIDVPGLGRCPAVAAAWLGTHPGHLLLARWGDEAFSVEERNLVRGMARLLELTLTMLRTLQAEHAMRERSERQARLLEQLSVIQRSISRREPLQQILDTVTAAARDLLGGDIVGLWLCDPDDAALARLRSSVGLDGLAKRLPAVSLADAGAAGAAIICDDVAVAAGSTPVLGRITGGRLCASIAAPVHESGTVTGSLLVGSYRRDRGFTEADEQMLRAFAQNVSMALTDSQTVIRMNQAFHDALTGLASRGLFLERMAHQLESAQTDAVQVALLFVDLDRFKIVNDTLGHAAGDQLLMTTAERIKSQLRSTDVAARFGGDEFAIMLCGIKAIDEAVHVAERIVRALGEPMVIADRELLVNASIGIAIGGDDAADLMRRADIAMYQAKRNGRGRYEVYSHDHGAFSVRWPGESSVIMRRD